MAARDTDEEHRTSTPLELFFDLCFVVAVSLAAGHLHHDLSDGHAGHALAGYLPVFFAIWWAWMNFTWFASAYDIDDGLYRVTTLVQITGVLVLAAGVPRAFDDEDFTVVTVGYVLMRLAMVAQWLRAAHGDQDAGRRRSALRYAGGICVVQAGWVLRLLLPHSLATASFLVLVVLELLVPAWAERHAPTPWHAEHIAERYGLFTLIVLGESVLAATTAMQSAVDSAEHVGTLIGVAAAGLVIVFAMWWLYFDRSVEHLLTTMRVSLVWGYGHYLVFGSAAAVGAGLQVTVDHDAGHAAAGTLLVGWALAVPVAVFLLSVWLLQVRACPEEVGLPVTVAFPVVAALVLASPLTGAAVYVIAGLVAVLVVVSVVSGPARRPLGLAR